MVSVTAWSHSTTAAVSVDDTSSIRPAGRTVYPGDKAAAPAMISALIVAGGVLVRPAAVRIIGMLSLIRGSVLSAHIRSLL